MFSGQSNNRYEDPSDFPMLLTEPWRVNELLEKEALIQQYRLFKSTSLSRLVIIILAFFVLKNDTAIAISTGIVIGCYFLLACAWFLYIRVHINHIQLYNFFISLFDAAILGYLYFYSKNTIELSFLFFSVLLSAMALPLYRLMIVVFVAYFIITLSDNNVPFQAIINTLSSPESLRWEVIKKGLKTFSDKETITLIVGFILLAVTVNRLAFWSFANEVQARFRHKQLRQVLAYNRSIIEHLKTGVITLTTDGKIVSINRQAIDLLKLKIDQHITDLDDISQTLSFRYKTWLSEGVEPTDSYRNNTTAEEVSISFSRFDTSQNLVMMSIESINAAFQRANEAKLNSLGRLTASIAHEIRNPLTSINTAAQLMSENAHSPQDKQLTHMVLNNVKRADQIINDVLSLFKDSKPSRDRLHLQKVLTDFCKDFIASHKDQKFSLRVISHLKQPVYALFDLGQFMQVLWNLCNNALKYANTPELEITIIYHLSTDQRMLCIDFCDNGVGIPKEKHTYLFEPFYTGSTSGSGLGLYIVRELCSANNANIFYVPDLDRVTPTQNTQGACFRITSLAYFSKK